MSEKHNGEFSNSANNPNLDPKKPIYDELDNVFKEQSHSTPEQLIHPNAARLFAIADSIASSRADHLKAETSHRVEIENKYIKALFKTILGRDWKSVPIDERILMEKESAIGSSVFGLVKPGESRKFFNENRNNWYFYEEKIDSNGVVCKKTLHYEVDPTRPTGVLRVANRPSDNKMVCFDPNEIDLGNLLKATEVYYGRVMRELYNTEPTLDKNVQ